MRRIAMLCVIFGSLVLSVGAQGGSCSAIASDALENVDNNCSKTDRNQVCYANEQIDVTFVEDAGSVFEGAGDIVNVADLQNLRLYSMDVDAETWGVASMVLQANVAGSSPGQNVTMVMFGDVELETGVRSIQYDVTSTGGINVRGGPSTEYSVVGSLSSGETVKADGRNEAADWLRITFDEGTVGWVWVPLITTEADITLLAVLETSDEPDAFYIRTGIGDAPCINAPNSGVLFQTPDGVGEVSFLINEVNFRVGSTIFVQAEAEGDMVVNVIEGAVTLGAFGEEQTARTNMRLRVPLDENLAAAGPPSPPEACDANDLQGLGNYDGLCSDIQVNLGDTQCPITVPSGMRLILANSYGYENLPRAEAEYAQAQPAVLINDEVTDAQPSELYDFSDPSNPENYDPDVSGWGFHATYFWNDPEPGVYEVFGAGPQGSAIINDRTRSCEITVLE